MYLDELEKFSDDNGMKINNLKSKVMKFSRAKNMDFPLNIAFKDGKDLETISEMKLLGNTVSDDQKGDGNIQFICKKARKKSIF